MKVLRVTSFDPSMSGTPLMIVARASDIEVSPEEAGREHVRLTDQWGVFTLVDIFEAEDGIDIVRATTLAMERAVERESDEKNMAILYYYEAKAFGIVAPHGIMLATIPAPLSVADVRYALERLAAHPKYEHQRVIFPVETDNGHVTVTLDDGTVRVETVTP